ncbi:hypothetical protein [uncultured Kordia sp.]|uniref:hypothetical protein n=1 Tax=uncultured Kordia sp. TaxID=507699 RepID=UPI002603B110|nr:hypothetical protein [uncultured Kordia sp.]
MNEKLIEELRKKSVLGRKFEESTYFHAFFEDVFRNMYSEICDQNYYKLKIPDAYIEFLKAFPNGIVHLGDDYGFFGIIDCVSQTINDITLWSPYDEERGKLASWIYIGVRGDKGNIYLCCDSSSDYFGKIEEFYDGSAFMNDTLSDPIKMQNFEEFCQSIMDES